MQRPGERPDGGDEGAGHVGTGAGRDPTREGRGVEAVVDGGDEVLLDGPSGYLRWLGARAHPEIIGGVAELGVRFDRLQAVATSMMAGEDRRDHCGEPDGVVAQLLGRAVQGRAPILAVTHAEDADPQGVHRIGEALCGGVDERADAARQPPVGPAVDRGGIGREGAIDLQRPHILEGTVHGELGRVVLAVVEEALLATDVTEDGVGHGEALQAGGCDLGFGHASNVTQRCYIDNLDRINIDWINVFGASQWLTPASPPPRPPADSA